MYFKQPEPYKMTVNSKITISKRVIAIFLVALLAFSAFNTYLILVRTSGPNCAVPYDFVVSSSGNNYELKNMLTGSSKSVSSDASNAISSALTQGNSIFLNTGNYTLKQDILISNKMNVKVVGNDATIIGNGHKIILSGDNFSSPEYATISGLTLINGTIRVENSFGTTIVNMIFENTSTGIELANTKSWSENTKIEDCRFINATEGIALRTPTGNATGSYESSEINRCFFNLKDNSVGINVEASAQFSDSQLQDVRFWLGEDGVTNQTGIYVNGSMDQTLLSSVVFESFTTVPNDMFAVNIGQSCDPAPVLDTGVSFLGNWTAMVFNPYSKWISGVSTAFEKDNVSVPVGVNNQYSGNASIQTLPLRIFSFKPKINVENIALNEMVTVKIRFEYVDNSFSSPVVRSFSNTTSVWLTDDEIMQLYPSQNIIWAVLVDAKSNSTASNAKVTVSGYGTAG